MNFNESTSIKELLQGIAGNDIEIIIGLVTSGDTGPLEIEVIGDPKLILNESTVVIPWHLTDYRTWFSFDSPAIKQKIDIYDRPEKEELPQAPWAGEEPHPRRPDDTPPPEIEQTTDITFQKKRYENTRSLQDDQGNAPPQVCLPAFHEVTVYNALRKDDLLYVLQFNRGKKYFILDRVLDPALRRREGDELGLNMALIRQTRIP